MFLDGEKGTSFDIVVAVVFDQVFDSLAGSGAFLDFIEDNDRMPLLQCDIIDELELSEKIRLFVGIPKFICENVYGIPKFICENMYGIPKILIWLVIFGK